MCPKEDYLGHLWLEEKHLGAVLRVYCAHCYETPDTILARQVIHITGAQKEGQGHGESPKVF
jgi:hypothetical protein